ncbi:hypothetical protein BH11BAC5_BH11BAC5_52880 [soil metagenome]
MKFNYLPVSLTYNSFNELNVEALFAKMAKETISNLGTLSTIDFNLTSGFETFIFKKGSSISNQLLANPQAVISLDLLDFKLGTLNLENGSQPVYYHLDIFKEIIADNFQKNFKLMGTIFYSTHCRVCLAQTDMVNKLERDELGFEKHLSHYSIWKFVNFKKIQPCRCGAKNFEIKFGKFSNGIIIPYFEKSFLEFEDDSQKGFLEITSVKRDNKMELEINKSTSVTNSIFRKLLDTVDKSTRFLDAALDYRSNDTLKDDGHYYVLVTFELKETSSGENNKVKTISSRVEELSYLGFDLYGIRIANHDIFKFHLDSQI